MSTKDNNKTEAQHDAKLPVSRGARLAAACRRFQFETIKSLGIFWLIEKIPGLMIKEPWRKLYERSKR